MGILYFFEPYRQARSSVTVISVGIREKGCSTVPVQKGPVVLYYLECDVEFAGDLVGVLFVMASAVWCVLTI